MLAEIVSFFLFFLTLFFLLSEDFVVVVFVLLCVDAWARAGAFAVAVSFCIRVFHFRSKMYSVLVKFGLRQERICISFRCGVAKLVNDPAFPQFDVA